MALSSVSCRGNSRYRWSVLTLIMNAERYWSVNNLKYPTECVTLSTITLRQYIFKWNCLTRLKVLFLAPSVLAEPALRCTRAVFFVGGQLDSGWPVQDDTDAVCEWRPAARDLGWIDPDPTPSAAAARQEAHVANHGHGPPGRLLRSRLPLIVTLPYHYPRLAVGLQLARSCLVARSCQSCSWLSMVCRGSVIPRFRPTPKSFLPRYRLPCHI